MHSGRGGLALASAAVGAALVVLGACGLDQAGVGADASVDADATVLDAQSDGVGPPGDVVEAGADVVDDTADAAGGDVFVDAADGGLDCGSGALCNNRCLPDLNCGNCDAGRYFCQPLRACVGDCVSCSGFPISCCTQTDDPTASCLPFGIGGCQGSLKACPCNDASDCPGAQQVCEGNDCTTCGEDIGTDGKRCKGQGSCNFEAGVCQ
jgi:hypothetical protein